MCFKISYINMKNREHNMVRFKNGLPQAVWFSQHDYGLAISYEAVQKIGKRPVAFSAKGSHANYLTAASHDLAKLSGPPPFCFPSAWIFQIFSTLKLTSTQTVKFHHILFTITPHEDRSGIQHSPHTTTHTLPQPQLSRPP